MMEIIILLVKIEFVALRGSGKVNITGTNNQELKENIKNTYNYIHSNTAISLPAFARA